jgi:hypothetical protein
MSYDQWVTAHNSDSDLLRKCWEAAQADMKQKLEQTLGNENGYAQRRFYPRLADVLKEIK